MPYTPEQQRRFMAEALTEGRRALPACLPNPPVGCVLVDGGEIVARGFTNAPGQHHAEAMALAQLTGELSQIAAFITLEPCSFADRTPSCAKALIARRVGAVYVALIDPDPRNRGQGLQMLRDAGIAVVLGVEAETARRELGPYLHSEAV